MKPTFDRYHLSPVNALGHLDAAAWSRTVAGSVRLVAPGPAILVLLPAGTTIPPEHRAVMEKTK